MTAKPPTPLVFRDAGTTKYCAFVKYAQKQAEKFGAISVKIFSAIFLLLRGIYSIIHVA
jgi:uncharacterized membrane protein